MTDQNPSGNPSQGGSTNSTPPVAFCQNCGKPLDKESARVVGSSVFCEPCLAARVRGEPGPVPPGAQSNTPWSHAAWSNPAWPSSGVGPTTPNPGLATLLGFIPGVGAMYNEQYAKGIVHLIVFAVLVSLVDANSIFLLFVFGWVFYMAFEAHHTAIARRDGTPLPNPFGLNDIGERFGFGRAWPAQPHSAPAAAAAPGASTPPPYSGPGSPGWVDPAGFTSNTTEVPGWGAPVDIYGQSRPGQPGSYGTSDPNQVPPPGAQMPPYGYGPYTARAYNATYVPPIPGAPDYIGPDYIGPDYIAPPSRFPAGAVWLIGLGTLFLLSTTGVFSGIRGGVLVGLLLIGLGVWIFLRRMVESGGMVDAGSPGYSLRLIRAARGAVWLVLFGVLFLLSEVHLLSLHRSWPLIIIAAGVMALLERAAWTSAPIGTMPGNFNSPYNPSPAPPASSSMSVVPAPDPDDHDAQKGGR